MTSQAPTQAPTQGPTDAGLTARVLSFPTNPKGAA